MFTASLAVIAALAFVAGVAMYLFDVGKGLAPWAFLIAGLGITGFLGGVIGKLAGVVTGAFTHLMGAALGAAATIGIVVLLGVYLWSRMIKSKRAGKLTMLVALIFPAVLVTVGLGSLVSMASSAVTTGGSTLSDLLGAIGG